MLDVKDIERRRYKRELDVFLASLRRQAERTHVTFFYEYVKAMSEYYSTCFVVDDSIIEIDMPIQMTDMGDKVCNCMLAVEMEVMKYAPLTPHGKFTFWTSVLEYDGEDDGMEEVSVEAPHSNTSFRRTAFKSVGSNRDKLLVRWLVDLKNVDVCKGMDEEEKVKGDGNGKGRVMTFLTWLFGMFGKNRKAIN